MNTEISIYTNTFVNCENTSFFITFEIEVARYYQVI